MRDLILIVIIAIAAAVLAVCLCRAAGEADERMEQMMEECDLNERT